MDGSYSTDVPFLEGKSLQLGLGYWPFTAFTVFSEVNAVNVTDGLDGLATGTCAVALASVAFVLRNSHEALAVMCASMSGSCFGEE